MRPIDADNLSSRKLAAENVSYACVEGWYGNGWNDAIDTIMENEPSVPLPDFKEGYKQAIIDGKTNFSRGWIPVSEALPEINASVIVTDVETTETYSACYLGDGIWECDNGARDDRIIAWMPFPEPYKDEKSSNLLMDIIEDRCSCCGNPLMQNGGTIIAGRCRSYILCPDCDKRKDEFIKWSDEE